MSEKMMTWEELNPDWREYGDLTERFAQSQFDNCPGCGHFGVRVYIGSEDDEVCVICTGCEQWQAWGDCPSEAIDTWNKRVDAGSASVDRKEIEWEFKKVRKMVEDAIPAHHRTGPAGVVYAAMVAAMDAVLEMMEEGNELSSVDKKHP